MGQEDQVPLLHPMREVSGLDPSPHEAEATRQTRKVDHSRMDRQRVKILHLAPPVRVLHLDPAGLIRREVEATHLRVRVLCLDPKDLIRREATHRRTLKVKVLDLALVLLAHTPREVDLTRRIQGVLDLALALILREADLIPREVDLTVHEVDTRMGRPRATVRILDHTQVGAVLMIVDRTPTGAEVEVMMIQLLW